MPEQIALPAHEERLYGFMAESQLIAFQQALTQPQYVLVVDANPHVQAAFLFWRLLPGRYELVGASPASTGKKRATCAIPGFPGEAITSVTARSRDSFQAMACSRPPEPMTRTFMLSA